MVDLLAGGGPLPVGAYGLQVVDSSLVFMSCSISTCTLDHNCAVSLVLGPLAGKLYFVFPSYRSTTLVVVSYAVRDNIFLSGRPHYKSWDLALFLLSVAVAVLCVYAVLALKNVSL